MNETVAYYAKSGSPFDKDTELDLIEDYRRNGDKSGLFMGYRDGKLIEILCDFREIRIEHQRDD